MIIVLMVFINELLTFSCLFTQSTYCKKKSIQFKNHSSLDWWVCSKCNAVNWQSSLSVF